MNRRDPGGTVSPLAARVSGKRYVFPANDQHLEAIAFDFGRDTCRITVWNQRGAHPRAVGSGAWLKGTSAFASDQPLPVAASGAWIAEDTYAVKLCFAASRPPE